MFSRILPAVMGLGLVVGASSTAQAEATKWNIDASHSEVAFKVRHLMVSNTRGVFGKFEGTATIDDKDLSKSSVEVTIDAASVDTGDEKRDGHLKSPDFFDVEKFPKLTFKSKSVKKLGKDKLAVKGDLTIHGVTKEVTLDVTGLTAPIKDPWGNTKRGLSASTKINRKDFGLAWNAPLEAGGVVVGEEVTISLEVELGQAK